MRSSPVLGVVGVVLLAFAWWGARTAAGRRTFDEMAGTIPLGAGALGGLLVIAAIALAVLRR